MESTRRKPHVGNAMRSDSGPGLGEYSLVLTLMSLSRIAGLVVIEKATVDACAYVTAELLNHAERRGQ